MIAQITMKRMKTSGRLLLFSAALLLFAPGCDDKLEEHYEPLPDQKGNTWDMLAEAGNYNSFLQAVERAGFKPYLYGKGITTTLAPDDEAMNTYLQEHGYASIGDMSKEELQELVGYHLLYYSYNKSKMENFRPEGQIATNTDTATMADKGLYYKFRSHSSAPTTKAIHPTTGKEITIYHQERFVPVFSHLFFKTKGIDAKSNYEYFYPSSLWTGDDGFNIAGATVEKYAVPTSNGYIYKIDKVLEPEETLHGHLLEHPEYSRFLSLYDRFSEYIYDATLTADYGEALGADSLFVHSHAEPLAPIAMDWPTTDYVRLDTLAYKAYSLFAPTNEALADFFDSYWAGNGYADLESLDRLVVQYLLAECVNSGSIIFPEEITSGKALNRWGMKYNFNPEEIEDRTICTNGAFYGVGQFQAPRLFDAVTGPAFSDRNYLPFLYALHADEETLVALASDKLAYTVLMPSEATFALEDIHLMEYANGNSLQTVEADGTAASLSNSALSEIVSTHYAIGEYDLMAEGTQVVPLAKPYRYWFVRDGEITYSSRFNQLLEPVESGHEVVNPFAPLSEVLTNDGTAWSNGKVYTYDATNLKGLLGTSIVEDNLQKRLAVCNDERYPYYVFSKLLAAANMVDGNNVSLFEGAGRYIAFIPSNEVLYEALSRRNVPGVLAYRKGSNGLTLTVRYPEELQSFLKSFFVDAAAIPTCPYVGSEMKSGEYYSLAQLEDDGTNTNNKVPVRSTLLYTDDGSGLSIALKDGENTTPCRVVEDYGCLPFCFADGSMHIIDGLLK